MKIEKKVWPEYFQKILNGEKTFELRLADFECKKGDVKFWPQEEVDKYGFQIISFK